MTEDFDMYGSVMCGKYLAQFQEFRIRDNVSLFCCFILYSISILSLFIHSVVFVRAYPKQLLLHWVIKRLAISLYDMKHRFIESPDF